MYDKKEANLKTSAIFRRVEFPDLVKLWNNIGLNGRVILRDKIPLSIPANQPDIQQRCDVIDEKDEVPFYSLQEAIYDQCNHLNNIFNTTIPHDDLTGITPTAPEGPDFYDVWTFLDNSDPAYGTIQFGGRVQNQTISIWTNRREFRDRQANRYRPYTSRENEPRTVMWVYQKPIVAKWNWDECFYDYFSIVSQCGRPGDAFFGSRGGTSNVTRTNPYGGKTQWKLSAVHPYDPKASA
ncbi:hypothetical protein ABW20_dc0101703 [Dactylellina cionopaga]|nr:hypothetical protein ABW20_dc0101703 [Dactylellina cionopaga]